MSLMPRPSDTWPYFKFPGEGPLPRQRGPVWGEPGHEKREGIPWENGPAWGEPGHEPWQKPGYNHGGPAWGEGKIKIPRMAGIFMPQEFRDALESYFGLDGLKPSPWQLLENQKRQREMLY